MTAFPIVLFVLLGIGSVFLIGGIILVVSLLTSKNQGARTIGWILLACGVIAPLPLLFIGLFTLRVSQPRSEPIDIRYPEVHRVPTTLRGGQPAESVFIVRDANERSEIPPAWLPQVEQEFEANVYPSRISAASSLGRRLADGIQFSDPSGEQKSIAITIGNTLREQFDAGSVGLASSDAVADEVAKRLRAAFPGANVNVNPLLRAGETQVVVKLSLSDWQRQRSLSGPVSKDVLSGTIHATIDMADSDIEQTVTFVDKPWAEFNGGTDQKISSGERSYRVARSQKLAASEEEARNLANDAADRLFVHLTESNHNAIPDAIRSGDLVADRFTQRLSRPYGDVYREAILVDVTPARLASVQRQVEVAEAKILSNVTGRLLGFAVIMAIASILYVVLNTLTRGYYRRPVFMIVGTIVLMVSLAVVLILSMHRSRLESARLQTLSSNRIGQVMEVSQC